jgi:YVTN family beta-propeller protein
LAIWRRDRKVDVHMYGASHEQRAPHPQIQGAVARPDRSAEAWHDSAESKKSTRTLRARKRRARHRRVLVGATVAIIAAAAISVFAAEGNKTIAASYPEREVTFRSSSPGSAGLALAHPPHGFDVPRTPPQVGSNEGHQAGVYSSITTGRIDARVRDVPTRVYVPNNHSNSVDVIDPRTHRVVRSFSVGDSPQHVTPGWNMRFLYVGDIYSNTLTVIDPRTQRAVRTIQIPDPYNLYFTPDGSHAIDVAERLSTLFFYDPKTWKVDGTVHIPWAGPNHLDFSKSGRYLLISTEFDGHIVRVDTTRLKVVGSIDVGGLPVDVKLSPDGSSFYVANQGRGGVSVIDPIRMREADFIRTGAGAHGLCISRDARSLYVSNRVAGTISVIDVDTNRVRDTWHVGGSPDMLQVSADGRELWVSNRYDATVSVIGTRTGQLQDTIAVGSSPHGLTLFPQPGRFSIGHNGVYR